jgi:hypothetical protein
MVQLGSLVPGGNKYRNLVIHVGGVSKIETIKYAHESRGGLLSGLVVRVLGYRSGGPGSIHGTNRKKT